METTYHVVNFRTRELVGKVYHSHRTARNAVDRADLGYGAYTATVHEGHPTTCKECQRTASGEFQHSRI